MKIILTSQQIKLLTEQRLQYEPRKIDEIVAKGIENLEVVKKWYNKFNNTILTMTISDAIEDMGKYEETHKKMKLIKDQVDTKIDEYYKIVEPYEPGETPRNVMDLDDIQTEMGNINYLISDLFDILDDILSFAKKHAK